MALIKTELDKPIKSKNLDIARVERSTALADSLFKPYPLKDGARLHVKYQVSFKLKGTDAVAEWRGAQLDSVDLNVFLALSRLASIEHSRKDVSTLTCNKKVVNALEFDGKKKDENLSICYIKSSIYNILKECGYTDSGKNYKRVYESIMRLCSIRLNIYNANQINKNFPDLVLGSSLIGNISVKEKEAVIIYNPLVMHMLNGSIDGCLIDMAFIRKAKTDVTKKLVFWLSAWASYDRLQKISIDTLVNHVWAGEINDGVQLRKRRVKIRNSIKELISNGWYINTDEDIFLIKRPKM